MLLWELSLRHPLDVTNVRIPGPFVTHSATSHISTTTTLIANTSGNLLVVFDPFGAFNSFNNFLTVYNASGFVDGTLSTASYALANPFLSTSGKPVANYQYRTVSACMRVIPMSSVTSL